MSPSLVLGVGALPVYCIDCSGGRKHGSPERERYLDRCASHGRLFDERQFKRLNFYRPSRLSPRTISSALACAALVVE